MISEVPFAALRDYVERNFREVAQDKGLDFQVEPAPRTCRPPSTPTRSDCSRCCATCSPTAFKFTEQGQVNLA